MYDALLIPPDQDIAAVLRHRRHQDHELQPVKELIIQSSQLFAQVCFNIGEISGSWWGEKRGISLCEPEDQLLARSRHHFPSVETFLHVEIFLHSSHKPGHHHAKPEAVPPLKADVSDDDVMPVFEVSDVLDVDQCCVLDIIIINQ